MAKRQPRRKDRQFYVVRTADSPDALEALLNAMREEGYTLQHVAHSQVVIKNLDVLDTYTVVSYLSQL